MGVRNLSPFRRRAREWVRGAEWIFVHGKNHCAGCQVWIQPARKTASQHQLGRQLSQRFANGIPGVWLPDAGEQNLQIWVCANEPFERTRLSFDGKSEKQRDHWAAFTVQDRRLLAQPAR